MRKELVVYTDGQPARLTIRNYGPQDFAGLIDVQRASFPPPFPSELWWNEAQLSEHVSRFPEGALCAVAGGEIVGSMTGLLVSDEQLAGKHDWGTLTDNGYIKNHDPAGSTLYVVDICVVPAYRKAGVGKWLMQSMYETVVHLGKQRLLGGGRMPGYYQHAATTTPEQYLENVMTGVWHDPVIGFLLRCGRMPVGIAHEYLEDEESCGYAALMEWRNPFLLIEESE
jgi:ribosomal protein S18 acetylase RimI-like enzyme